MARDIFIHFDNTPSVEEVSQCIARYFNDMLVTFGFNGNKWIINLPGKSEPQYTYSQRYRWVEIYTEKGFFVVATREQDDITNAIAIGLAKRLVYQFKGTLGQINSTEGPQTA